jgi:hypothetical protein
MLGRKLKRNYATGEAVHTGDIVSAVVNSKKSLYVVISSSHPLVNVWPLPQKSNDFPKKRPFTTDATFHPLLAQVLILSSFHSQVSPPFLFSL